jgi:Rieske Fe-S protein
MPFSGLNPGNKRVFVHTGDSGQGITNAVAGALTIVPLIAGEDAPFAGVLDPTHKPIGAPALAEFAKGQAGVIKNFAEHVGPSKVGSEEDIAPGEGAILREGLRKLAIYRAEDGTLIRRSAICTHAKCIVHWNTLEKCWDCSCPGSHFAPDEHVLNGPVVDPLSEA